MPDMEDSLSLPSAGRYANPRSSGQALPVVYGTMEGGTGGLWQAVCVDTEAHVYALAGHQLLPLELGNQVRLYDREGNLLDQAGYSLDLSHDYQGQRVIATATFATDMEGQEPLSVAGMGKPGGDGLLLENPLDLVRDLLLNYGGLSDLDLEQSALSRARARAAQLGYRASGVIAKSRGLGQIITDILGDFLGSWWLGADNRLKLSLDLGSGAVEEAELAVVFNHNHLRGVSVSAKLANLVNQARVYYRHHPLEDVYQAELAESESQDIASIGLYGARLRELELNWVRDPSTALAVAGRLLAFLSRPRRLISAEEDALANLHLERGDAALFSLPWLADELGRPLVNQIVRVLSMEPQLDRGNVRFTLLDTGFAKTITRLADGTLTAAAQVQAGGERDRTEYSL